LTDIREIVDVPCIIRPETCYCGGTLKPLGSGPFFVRLDGERVNLRTILYYCKKCDLSIRGLDYNDPMVLTHYELALYTDPKQEEYWRERRRIFFEWFYQMSCKHLGRQPTEVLDFGCSYGHLLDVFADKGAHTLGIEVSPQMIQKIKKEGRHQVSPSLQEADIVDASLDIIIAIDSIYCCGQSDPTDLLASFSRKLRPGGILITRTTNRNLVHRLYTLRWHLFHGRWKLPAPIPYHVCGDAMFNFSERALVSRYAAAGLTGVTAYRWEKKRKRLMEYIRDVGMVVMYYASVKKIDLCPGLVLVARKSVG